MQKASSWVTQWPPISLGILAAIAKPKAEVFLLDGNIENLKLGQLIENVIAFRPDLIVISTGFPSIEEDMSVARELKLALPYAKILAFGMYFSILEKQGVEDCPFLDFCIIGEPEETFRELLAHLENAKTDYARVKGLAFWQDGKPVVNEKREMLDDLDKLPHPDRDLFKNNRYQLPHNNRPFTLVNTGRGCPYQCFFCVANIYSGVKARKHSVGYVIEEITQCIERYGIREFLFWEEVFTIDRSYVLELCRAINEHRFNIHWAASTRVDLLDDELLAAMKEAGCYLLGLGIESFNQAILDAAKKATSVSDVPKAVELCHRHGIKVMGHFIFGLPGETKETAENTISSMLKTGLDYMQAYCAIPYPKTGLGKMAEKNGWIIAKRWPEYDFGGSSILELPTISAEQVSFYRKVAFRKFYFRFRYVLKTAFKEISLTQTAKLLKFSDWIGLKKDKR